jgi:hypothetical protein
MCDMPPAATFRLALGNPVWIDGICQHTIPPFLCHTTGDGLGSIILVDTSGTPLREAAWKERKYEIFINGSQVWWIQILGNGAQLVAGWGWQE